MEDRVEILGIAFPRLTRSQLLERMLNRLNSREGVAVCFPDMSTMNLIAADPALRKTVATRFEAYNDGAGLALAARLKRRPFPDNLNGTDFIPLLLHRAPADTRVFLVGGQKHILSTAEKELARRFPHLCFVGSHHGYFEPTEMPRIIETIGQSKPDIVLVAMGNPRQIDFINACLGHAVLSRALFFAVGGLLHYFAGDLTRAPKIVRMMRLEWLFIVLQQPYKFKRYFIGIPRFFTNLINQR